MAATSDKARFYLEQSVPELREWEKKDIFSREEISAIAAKRSDFEHILNARGSKPADYARYAEYEMNLDSLRRKRVKRKGVKSPAHTGQRRIFLILDRATRKFHGDMGLWMQYIEYARKQKANKKIERILTDALRLHPTKPELWIYAARYAMDVQADVGTARSYLQRGLRFCKASKGIYLEYARFEMAYIAKLAARRKILGLDPDSVETVDQEAEEDEFDADMIALPPVSVDESETEQRRLDPLPEPLSRSIAESPVMSGAIPLAIYDTAMKQFSHSPGVAQQFFDMFSDFSQTPCISKVLQHVVDDMLALSTTFATGLACQCKKLLVGVSPTSSAFPSAVRLLLAQIKASMLEVDDKDRLLLAGQLRPWLDSFSRNEELDEDLRRVFAAATRRLEGEIGK